MKSYLILMILSLSLTILSANSFANVTDRKYLNMVKDEIKTEAFEAYQSRSNPNYKFTVFTKEHERLFFIVSTDYSRLKGYQGTTTLGIVFNDSLQVKQASIIRSQETASYIKRINAMGFMRKFADYRPGDEVEIISGATMTCDAIIKSIDESLAKVKPLILEYLK